MTIADGYVGATAKIVDHGSDSDRWNLVILGDGYQASELDQYHADVETFLDRLRFTPPFDELWCGINVHRIDVVSNESGADDPADCPEGTPTGAEVDTYFDAEFCQPFGGTRLHRLLGIDSALALSVASRVIERDQVLVLVNSPIYGGSGGTVATASTNAQSAEIAIHEMGHSAFGLADEYEGSNVAGAEPTEPNVTVDTNRATNKWGDLIDPATPMPSSCYGDCTTCAPPGTPPAPGAVGTYEGARYAHCGIFRPLPNCYMRDYQPFCPVCARVIRQTLAPFLPTESISLITPSINFQDVPEGPGATGITTYRAVVWDVVSCRNLTFRIVTGPTGGFGTPFGTQHDFAPAGILPVEQARIWLSYTSTSAPDTASGSVTVECVETAQQWTININANTIVRPKSAVALVLDRSGSMSEDAGDATSKVQKLREAAEIFVDVMLPGDGVGIVSFDDLIDRLMDITDVGPEVTGPGRGTAIGHITGPGLEPRGATSIGGGVLEGKAVLDDGQAVASPPYDVLASVVLTDGMENTAPMLSTVTSSITANTFAVGLGLPSNISVSALTELCQGNDGYLLITGEMSADQSRLLSKYFLQILAGVSNAQVAVDPRGELSIGVEHRIPFEVSEADYGMDVLLLTALPRIVDFQLETPTGDRISASATTSAPAIEYILRRNIAYYRSSLPVAPAQPERTHAGLWHAVIKINMTRRQLQKYFHGDIPGHILDYLKRAILPYDLIVHTYSNLVFHASATQSHYEPGADVSVYATLSEYDVPVDGRGQVWADLTRPDGTTSVVMLHETEPGRFEGGYATTVSGLYTMRVRAAGETFHGSRFMREQTLTAAVRPGGNTLPTEQPTSDPWCEVLRCLVGSNVLGCELKERLQKWGVDVEALIKCLKDRCRPRKKGESPYGQPDVSATVDPSDVLDDLIAVVDRWRSGK